MSLEELLVVLNSKKNSKCIISICTFESPIGLICSGADEDVLYFVATDFTNKFQHFLSFLTEELNCKFEIRDDNIILNKLNEELKAYFSGDLKKFTVPIKLYGTEFKKVSTYLLIFFSNWKRNSLHKPVYMEILYSLIYTNTYSWGTISVYNNM